MPSKHHGSLNFPKHNINCPDETRDAVKVYMKKTFTLIAAAAALTVTAAVPAGNHLTAAKHFDASAIQHQTIGKGHRIIKGNAPAKAPKKAAQGESKFYEVSAISSFSDYGDYYQGETNDLKMVNVSANQISVTNMVYGCYGDTPTVGEISGDKVTFTFPQNYMSDMYEDPETGEIVNEEYALYVYDITKSEYEEDGETYYEYFFSLSDNQTVEFEYDSETGALTQLTDAAIGVAFMEEGEPSDTGIADFGYEMVLNTFISIPVVPEGLTYESYILNGYDFFDETDISMYCLVAFDEDHMYLKGISMAEPNIVVVFNKEGDKYEAPAGQYLGTVWDSYMAFFYPVNATEDYEEYEPLESYVMTVDAETKTISCVNPLDGLCINSAYDYLYPFDLYFDVRIEPGNSPDYAVPEPAYGIYYNDEDFDQYGAFVQFDCDRVSTEGEILDPYRMCYEVLLDGDPMVFYEDDFVNIDEDMELVPMTFTDGWDFGFGFNSNYFYIYLQGMDTIGIKVYYENIDGTMSPSTVTTLDLITGEETNSAVKSIVIDSDAIFYDLQGRRVANPDKGLYIVKSKDTTVKAIVK